MSDLLFAYGTLRGDGAEPAVLVGFRKRTDGPYPTIEPSEGDEVEGALVAVDDWAEKDRYEGRNPHSPERSLYWRLTAADGVQMYVGNPEHAAECWGPQHAWDVGYDRQTVADALAETEVFR
ncbi:MAG TPA: gamma-glutamylcyclotransferase family protein [Gemmatimonadota bacterium]|nr:gamma-glutamylcyclotransferase family protein [Gemmatimonadota bacterium]